MTKLKIAALFAVCAASLAAQPVILTPDTWPKGFGIAVLETGPGFVHVKYITDIPSRSVAEFYKQSAGIGTKQVFDDVAPVARYHRVKITTIDDPTGGVWIFRFGAISAASPAACDVATNCTWSDWMPVTLPGYPESFDPIPPDQSWMTDSVHPSGSVRTTPAADNENDWDLSPNGIGRRVLFDTTCAVAAGHSGSGKRLDEVLSALARLNGSGTMELQVPPGTECVRRWQFPARPNHTGWVVVKSSDPMIPPDGVRITPEWSVHTPTFIHNSMSGGGPYGQTLNTDANIQASCMEGEYNTVYNTSPRWLLRCGPNGYPASVPVAITGYSGGTFTAAGLIPAVGSLVTFSGTGLSINGVALDSTKARRVGAVDGNAFTLDPNDGTITGAWSGAGTVRRLADWRYVYVTSGTGRPTWPCSFNDVYRQTDVRPASGGEPYSIVGLHICYYPGTANPWREWAVHNTANSDSSAMFEFLPNASRYRFVGLRFSRQDSVAYGNCLNGKYCNSVPAFVSGATTGSSTSDIVFDRIIVDGKGGEMRTPSFMSLGGARIAILNSYITGIEAGFKWQGSGYFPGAYGANSVYISGNVWYFNAIRGKVLYENNYHECVGICLYADSGGLLGLEPDDGVIRRNTMVKPLSRRMGDPSSNGLYYHNRHHFELKRGARWLFEGNRLINNWSGDSDPNFAQPWTFTVVSGNHYDDDPPVEIIGFDPVTGVFTTLNRPGVSPGSMVVFNGTNLTGLDQQVAVRIGAVSGNTFTINSADWSYSDGIWSGGGTVTRTQYSASVTGGKFRIQSAVNGQVTVFTPGNGSLMWPWTEPLNGKLKFAIYGSENHDGVYTANAISGGRTFTISPAPSGTSTNGYMEIVITPFETSDILTQYNSVHNMGAGPTNYGDSVAGNYNVGAYVAKRITNRYNEFVNINLLPYSDTASGKAPMTAGPSFPFSNGSVVVGFSPGAHSTGVRFYGNIIDGLTGVPGRSLSFMRNDPSGFSPDRPPRHLYIRDNVVIGDTRMNTLNSEESRFGENAIPRFFHTPTTTFDGNVFCCNLSTARVVTAPFTNTYVSAGSALKFFGQTTNRYRFLWDSPYRGKGVDQDVKDQVQGKVSNARALRITATSAAVSYFAPDADACTLEYGTSSAWGSGTRINDGGGDRLRTVALSGLSGGTQYYYRVLCAVEQPSGVFVTQ